MNKSRLEAFSDGVIAIIITIMVLEIKMPHEAEWAALRPLLPVLYSYFLSFVFVGIYWGNHHHLLHTVKTVNSGIIWANMNLLFWLSLLPISTGWMGENHFEKNTVIVYAVLLLLSGISFTILGLTIQKTNPFDEKLTAAFAGLRTKAVISTTCYSLAIPLAFASTTVSGLLFLAVAIIWLIPDKNIERALKDK